MSNYGYSKFSVSNDIVMWKQKRICPVTEIEQLVLSVCQGNNHDRIVRIDRNIDKAIIRTMDKGLLCVTISSLESSIESAIDNYNVEDNNLTFIQKVMKTCDISEFDEFFNKEMSYEDYYHFCIAKCSHLNAKAIKELSSTFDDKYVRGMIIEACLLVKNEILDTEKINECLSLIGKGDIDSIIETILESHGVKMKVSKKSDYAFRAEVKSNMESSTMFPIFKAVNDLRKLKSSKSISNFEDILNSDLNLKFLKIMNLFETSKSVNLIVQCYNTLIDELGVANEEDYSTLKVTATKQKRYSNVFKSIVYSMKDIIVRLKDHASISEVEALVETVKDKI